MVIPFVAPPINPIISVTPLTTAQAGRDAPQVPQPLANVPSGTTVEGFVVNRDGQNNPILRTPLGDILIKSDFFLKTGSVIVFRVDNTQASRARIITIDGLTPSDYVAQNIRVPQTDSVKQPLVTPTTIGTSEEVPVNAIQEETIPLPLKAVLLTPSPAVKISAAPLQSLTLNPEVAASSEIPLVLQKLQAGAALKITIVKAELPLPATALLPQNSNASAINPATTALILTNTPTTITNPNTAPISSPSVSASPSPALPQVSPNISALAASETTPPQPSSAIPVSTPPGFTSPTPGQNFQTTLVPPERTTIIAASSVLPPSAAPTAGLVSPAPSSASAVSSINTPASFNPQPVLPVLQAATLLAAVSEAPTATSPAIPPTATPANQAAIPPLPAAAAISAYRNATHLSSPSPESLIPTTASVIAPQTSPPTTNGYTSTVVASRTGISVTVIASVIGHEGDGATILHTPIGTVKTYVPQQLPVGSQLTIHLETDQDASTVTQPIVTGSHSFETVTALAREWKSFDDTLQWLALSDPQIFNQITQQLPQAGPKLTSGLLFFIAAIKGGDVRNFLGSRATQLLENKATDLLMQLRADTGQWQQLATEAPGKQWAMLMMPVIVEGQIEPARLFYRQEEQSEESVDGKKGRNHHRFIIEVDLSHLGNLQFDGFVRDGRDARVFDLVLRSERVLTKETSEAIRTIFDNALKTTGYHGYLTFQQGSQHFVRPLANVVSDNGGAQPILA